MAISDIPVLSMLRTRLQWHQERQRVLAENVSNSDTPNFRPRDLAQPSFDQQIAKSSMMQVSLTRTEGAHITASGLSGEGFRTEGKTNYEVRPTGNAVSLEDEMMKVAANQMDYQAAATLYSRSLNLLKTALGKR
jgi:flagellar basal-body rod protein FlgB